MKALTIKPNWMQLFMAAEKTVEWRSWKTAYRGDIILCSSAKRIPGCISGHALMIAHLSNIVPFTRDYLAAACMDFMPDPPGYAWIFDQIDFIKPVPVKGQLGLWNLDITPEILPEDAPDEIAEPFYRDFIAPLIYTPVRR